MAVQASSHSMPTRLHVSRTTIGHGRSARKARVNGGHADGRLPDEHRWRHGAVSGPTLASAERNFPSGFAVPCSATIDPQGAAGTEPTAHSRSNALCPRLVFRVLATVAVHWHNPAIRSATVGGTVLHEAELFATLTQTQEPGMHRRLASHARTEESASDDAELGFVRKFSR